MATDYFKTIYEEKPITYELISQTVNDERNKGNRYIVLIGYSSLYDGGKVALDFDVILNHMDVLGYEFIQYVNNPYLRNRTELVFRRM